MMENVRVELLIQRNHCGQFINKFRRKMSPDIYQRKSGEFTIGYKSRIHRSQNR